MSDETPARAFGYVRVSTEDQAEHGSSVAAQEAQIRATCAARGWDLVEVFVDAGVSGGKALSTRPAGRRLLAGLEKGDVVIATKLDRLFRSAVDALTRGAAWRDGGIDLSVKGIDTTTPHGRAMFGIMAVLGELERELTAERTREVSQFRKAQGLVRGQVPMGAKVGPDGKTLIVDEGELDVLDRIRRLRSDLGLSFEHIASILNADSVAKKRGGTWSRGAVHHLYHAHAAQAA